MANFTPVSPAEASPEIRAIYDEICAETGDANPPNWATHLGSAPDLLRGYWEFVKCATSGELPELLRQLILFAVSEENGSSYCAQYHATIVLSLANNLNAGELRALVRGESHAVIPDSYRRAIAVAVAHARARCVLTGAEIQGLKKAGFSEREIMEIVASISLAQMFNAYTSAADVPIDEAYQLHGYRL